MNEPIEIGNSNYDEDLIARVRGGSAWEFRLWEPEQVAVVLGRSNQAGVEVEMQRCREDAVPVVRRRGAGGAVVLSPGIVVISVVKRAAHLYFDEYFWKINTILIAALERLGIEGVSQRGHSDICLGDRKILGSCMYGGQHLLFYTASLMVDNDLTLIDRYLKHPSREPDYRNGRPHLDFITNIRLSYPEIQVKDVIDSLNMVIPQRIHELD